MTAPLCRLHTATTLYCTRTSTIVSIPYTERKRSICSLVTTINIRSVYEHPTQNSPLFRAEAARRASGLCWAKYLFRDAETCIGKGTSNCAIVCVSVSYCSQFQGFCQLFSPPKRCLQLYARPTIGPHRFGTFGPHRSSPASALFHGVSVMPARWLTSRANTNSRSARRFK